MIQTYELLDDTGVVINTILATAEFMARYPDGSYRVAVVPDDEPVAE